MGKLTDLAAQLKTAAKGLLSEINNIDSKIAELNSQRDAITSGNVSKTDYLSYISAHFKIKADLFERQLAREISTRNIFDFANLERGYVGKDGFQGVYFLTGSVAPVLISENAMYFYFGEIILERIGDALESIDWPEDAMPVSERRNTIVEIEKSVAALYNQRAELVATIDAAGINR